MYRRHGSIGSSIPRPMTQISPYLPTPSTLSPPLLSLSSLPSEVGPIKSSWEVCMGERCKAVSFPSGSGHSQTAKRYLVHFGLKNASDESNFKGIFTKNTFVFSLFTSNNAILFGEAQTDQHITPCNFMLHFVTVCIICYLLLSCGHRSLLRLL